MEKNKQLSILKIYNVKTIEKHELTKVINNLNKTYKDVIGKVKLMLESKELKSLFKYIGLVPNCFCNENGFYWSDYIYDYFKYLMGNANYLDDTYFICTIYFNDIGDNIQRQYMLCQFSHLNLENKLKLADVLNKYLKGFAEWSGKNYCQLRIYFEEDNEYEIPIDTFRENDFYPKVKIHLKWRQNVEVNDSVINDDVINDFIEKLENELDIVDDDINYDYDKKTINIDIMGIYDCNISDKIKQIINDELTGKIDEYTINYYKTAEEERAADILMFDETAAIVSDGLFADLNDSDSSPIISDNLMMNNNN